MANIFRDQPKLRLGIGIAFVAFVWALYLTRATLGIGPMHDDQGNQSPAIHYLIGALVVTGMVICWLALAAALARKWTERDR